MPKPFIELHPSPLTLLRRRNGLDMQQAAEKLGVCTLKIARVERATRRIPVCVRRSMKAALSDRTASKQLSIFEYLDEIDMGSADRE